MAEVREQIRVANWMIFLIGLWLILAPFFVWYTGIVTALWSSVITGSVLILLSLAETVKPALLRTINWVNVAVGIWLVLAPFLLGFGDVLLATLVHFAMGIMVVALGLVSIIASRELL